MSRATAFTVFLAVYAAFFRWYGSGNEPITLEAAKEALHKAANLTEADAAKFDDGFLDNLFPGDRPDDGRSFVMVNFVKLREAAYFPEELKEVIVRAGLRVNMTSGAEADEQYGLTFLSHAVRRGAHPVFVSRSVGRSLLSNDFSAFRGDYFAVVRYRSRRDLVLTACEATEALGGGAVVGALKHSGVERTYVVPVSSIAVSHVFRRLVLVVGLVVVHMLSLCCCESGGGEF